MDTSVPRRKPVRSARGTDDDTAPAVVKLRRELQTELRYLRTVLREVTENYASAREADLEQIVEAVLEDGVSGRDAKLQGMLDHLRTLKVKPRKGRLKDIARIDKLVAELVGRAEELNDGT